MSSLLVTVLITKAITAIFRTSHRSTISTSPSIQIQIRFGQDVRDEVDSFYERVESAGRARPDDLFFLAYDGSELIGAVRLCIEESTPMLRTMMIAEPYRGQGVGSKLLAAFARHLDNEGVHNVYCIPYSHLESFYGSIGFRVVEPSQVPKFLIERMQTYAGNGKSYLCMKRD